jgi:hypothetical protein
MEKSTIHQWCQILSISRQLPYKLVWYRVLEWDPLHVLLEPDVISEHLREEWAGDVPDPMVTFNSVPDQPCASPLLVDYWKEGWRHLGNGGPHRAICRPRTMLVGRRRAELRWRPRTWYRPDALAWTSWLQTCGQGWCRRATPIRARVYNQGWLGPGRRVHPVQPAWSPLTMRHCPPEAMTSPLLKRMISHNQNLYWVSLPK